MKKLFVCAMALAAFVSCSKDDVQGPALDSANKSIAITIANSGSGTRAVTEKGKHGAKVAEAKDMHILFANSSKQILKVLPLTAGTAEHVTGTTDVDTYAPGASSTVDGNTQYVWHNVPAAVTNVAIIRDVTKDVIEKIEPGKTTMGDVKDYADNDTNLHRSLAEIFLYGEDEDGLELSAEEHVVVNGVEYDYYLGTVEVAPLFARFEINSIQCTDLGDDNKDTDVNTYGFDELDLTELTWKTANGSYSIPLSEFMETTMWGSYNNTTAEDNTNSEGDRTNYLTTTMVDPEETTTVWAWNVLPTTFDSMNVKFDAAAYDYELADTAVELNVTGLAASEGATASDAASITWKAGNIYRVDLAFEENNLGGKAGLCVKVTVEIAEWTVNTVYPVFGTSGSSTAQ